MGRVKETVYIFEAPPIDNWDSWYNILEYSELLKETIKKHPTLGIIYDYEMSEMQDLMLKVISGQTQYGPIDFSQIYIDFYCNIHIDFNSKEISPILAFKEVNNGTCIACSFNDFTDTILDFGQSLEDYFNGSDSLTFPIDKKSIPHENGDDWEIRPFDYEFRMEKLRKKFEHIRQKQNQKKTYE